MGVGFRGLGLEFRTQGLERSRFWGSEAQTLRPAAPQKRFENSAGVPEKEVITLLQV